MRKRILTGSALALAIFAFGSTRAAACDDDCDRCDGYAYYVAPAYYAAPVYYARPAFAYAPPVYYAAPAYAYYAPPTYYARPAYYAPPVYGYPYARPYYLGRGGYVGAGYVSVTNPAGRSKYASGANRSQQVNKALAASYRARAVSAAAANHIKPERKATVASNGVQGKYVPTANYGGPGGYIGLRR